MADKDGIWEVISTNTYAGYLFYTLEYDGTTLYAWMEHNMSTPTNLFVRYQTVYNNGNQYNVGQVHYTQSGGYTYTCNLYLSLTVTVFSESELSA